MRIAMVGAGSIGGFVGGALARSGHDVTLVIRPGSRRRGHTNLLVSSRLLGDFEAEVALAEGLDRDVDVIFVAVRTFQLEDALAALDGIAVDDVIVVPFMNGIDHVRVLREHLGAEPVVAGTIRVEAERVDADHIRQLTPFADIHLAQSASREQQVQELAAALLDAGFGCIVAGDESTVLWTKLAMLAPLALATSAAGLPIGGVRGDPLWNARLVASCTEACAVARADGASVATKSVLATLARLPEGMRSSMQKDLEAGRPLESNAIGGAVCRHGADHGLPTPATAELIELVATRVESVRHDGSQRASIPA